MHDIWANCLHALRTGEYHETDLLREAQVFKRIVVPCGAMWWSVDKKEAKVCESWRSATVLEQPTKKN